MTRFLIRNAWLPAGLFALFLAVSPGRLISFDVGVRLEIARALWTRHTVFVPTGSAAEAGLVNLSGNPGGTSFYGMGQSLILIPFDALGVLAARAVGATGWVAENLTRLPVVFLYIPLMGLAWWWAVAVWLQTLGLARSAAQRGAAIFSLTTILFVYSSQTAQEESLVGTLALLASSLWVRCLSKQSRWQAATAGFLVGYALLVRLNSFWILLPLLGATIDTYLRNPNPRALLRALGYATLGALPAVFAISFFAYWRFGSPFATGYDLAAAQGLGVTWGSFQWDVFLGLWIGFGKGLMVLSPLLWLAPLGWREAWKDRPFLGASIALALLGSTVLCAFIFNNPDGSECWGARYQVHLIGFLAFPVAIGLRRLRASAPALASGLLILSSVPQLAAVVAPDSYEYIQTENDHRPQNDLITGASVGHLALRLTNIARWVTEPLGAHVAPQLAAMEHSFIPGFWGFAWGQKLNDPGLRRLILLTWSALLAAALGCLAVAFVSREAT
jgi:hypothetical protein